jgi:hypothetical protein
MKQKLKMIRQILNALVVLFVIGAISSCEKNSYIIPIISTTDTLHFSVDIQPIFTANCVSCHSATRAPDLRAGKSFQALTTGGFVNLPGETCELYTVMIGSDHAARSSDADKQKVLIWVNQGALNN